MITYALQSDDLPGQVQEEADLKNEIAAMLREKGYRFVIADDDLISQRLTEKLEADLGKGE